MAHLLLKDTVLSDRRLPIPGKVVVLGRSLDVDVPVPHVSVSRRHALLERTATGFTLSDLGSSNGTFVEGRRLDGGERVEVAFGKPFRLGEVEFRLSPDEVLGEEIPPAPVIPAPAPVVNVVARPKPRPGAAERKPRARPSLARRGAMRRQRQDAMKWLGVLVTIVLVALAGVFLVKIVGKSSASADPGRTAEEQPEAERDDPSTWEIRPIGIDPD